MGALDMQVSAVGAKTSAPASRNLQFSPDTFGAGVGEATSCSSNARICSCNGPWAGNRDAATRHAAMPRIAHPARGRVQAVGIKEAMAAQHAGTTPSTASHRLRRWVGTGDATTAVHPPEDPNAPPHAAPLKGRPTTATSLSSRVLQVQGVRWPQAGARREDHIPAAGPGDDGVPGARLQAPQLARPAAPWPP